MGKKFNFPKKWVVVGVITSIICLAMGIGLSLYLVPPTQKIVEKVLPNTLFFKD